MNRPIDALPLSAENPVVEGDIVMPNYVGGNCLRVDLIRECDCPFHQRGELHLHFVCTPVCPSTHCLINTGQVYPGGYRYQGSRLVGQAWEKGSVKWCQNGGGKDGDGRDELFLVARKVAPLQAVPVDPNETLSLMLEGW